MVRGKRMWRVRWHEAGKARRKFLTNRDDAEVFASSCRGDAISTANRLASLSHDDQQKLLRVFDEVQRLGIDLSLVPALILAGKQNIPKPINDVLAEMLDAKRNAGRAGDYLNSLRGVCAEFIQGRERLAVDAFGFRDVEAFLDAHKIASRSTLRSRLATLFKFAVRRGYRADNPCDRLEAITRAHEPPAILSIPETKKCLDWLAANPRLLAWFALSTFAGLRPEEAEKTRWQDIHLDEGWIRVEAQTTKVRQRRIVYPLPTALRWLREAQKLRSWLPLARKTRIKEMQRLRAVLGWAHWKQDVTRHSAASYWLAHTGEAAKIATALGHSESVLRRNYLALVTKVGAGKFWAL